MGDVDVIVEESFGRHVEAALSRLRYLHPSWDIVHIGAKITVSKVDLQSHSDVRREVNYALYRERILVEGAPLRELLLKSVLG